MTMSKKKGKMPQFSLSLSRDCKIIPIKISLQEINMVFHCFFTFVSDFVIKNHKLGIVFNKLTTNCHLRFHFCNKSNPQYRNKNNAPPSASKTKKFFDRDGSGIPHPQALHFDDGEKKVIKGLSLGTA